METTISSELKGYRNVVELSNWFKDQLRDIHEEGFKRIKIIIKYE